MLRRSKEEGIVRYVERVWQPPGISLSQKLFSTIIIQQLTRWRKLSTGLKIVETDNQIYNAESVFFLIFTIFEHFLNEIWIKMHSYP